MADDVLPLVIANLLLALMVLAPVAIVASAGVCHLVSRLRHRSTEWVEIPGIGRVLVRRS